jgi:hypothetical protein
MRHADALNKFEAQHDAEFWVKPRPTAPTETSHA